MLHLDIKQEMTLVCNFYGDDLDRNQLQLHLQILKTIFHNQFTDTSSVTFQDIRIFIQGMSIGERLLISEVVTILKLILVLPSTNATSERTFSAMRRLKTYLRTTMKQERLNHLLLLHVHNDKTDGLECSEVAKAFVGDSEHRLTIFGRFDQS